MKPDKAKIAATAESLLAEARANAQPIKRRVVLRLIASDGAQP